MAGQRESGNYVAEISNVPVTRKGVRPLRNIITTATYLQLCCMQHNWSHARRGFERARDGEPEAAGAALALIGALYGHEKTMRARKLEGGAKLAFRRERSVPVAERFFAWCREQCGRADLLPKSPLAKALKYALDREAGLSVHRADADVPMDTNHLYADNAAQAVDRAGRTVRIVGIKNCPQGVEERQQFVVGPVDTLGDVHRPGPIHRLFLDLHVGMQVDLRRFRRLVAKPQGDDRAADSAAEYPCCQVWCVSLWFGIVQALHPRGGVCGLPAGAP